MIADYDELKSAVADFLNREDLASSIPTFIRLAESRIDRELRHWRQERRSEAMLDAQFNALPADFVQFVRFQLLDDRTGELSPISMATMLQMRADRRDRAGRPTHYALTGGGIELFPTPDGEYNASLVYYGKVTPLSATNTVNWLLTEAPDVYLYGALIHSAPYLKDDSRLTVWEALFKQGIDALNTSSMEARHGGAGLKMKTRRGAP